MRWALIKKRARILSGLRLFGFVITFHGFIDGACYKSIHGFALSFCMGLDFGFFAFGNTYFEFIQFFKITFIPF